MDTLQNLKILSIQSNRLTEIKGLEKLKNLEELYISHNAITEVKGLEHNVRTFPFPLSSSTNIEKKKLRVLDISNNLIEHLTGLIELKLKSSVSNFVNFSNPLICAIALS